MSFVAWIVLGLIAGFIGSKIVNKRGDGLILDIILGIVGAVVGGLIVGVTENLVGTYLIASQLKLTVAFALIILVLVFRPNGLFGTAIVRRV